MTDIIITAIVRGGLATCVVRDVSLDWTSTKVGAVVMRNDTPSFVSEIKLLLPSGSTFLQILPRETPRMALLEHLRVWWQERSEIQKGPDA